MKTSDNLHNSSYYGENEFLVLEIGISSMSWYFGNFSYNPSFLIIYFYKFQSGDPEAAVIYQTNCSLNQESDIFSQSICKTYIAN